MNCARTPEQDVKFTPKECENQYQYIIKTFEKEREEKGTSHKNDQIPLVRDPSVRAELFQKLMQGMLGLKYSNVYAPCFK